MRRGQFFILTTVLIAGALLVITNILLSTQNVNYAQPLTRHDIDMMSQFADKADRVWWNGTFRYRKQVQVREMDGAYLYNFTIPVSFPAREDRVNDTCSDIRVVDDGSLMPWVNTTPCNIETYDSATSAVARYKLDEATGSWANDSTPNRIDGTLVDSPVWTTGRFSAGLRFDGDADRIDVPDRPALQRFTNTFTTMFWMRPATHSITRLIGATANESFSVNTTSTGTLQFTVNGTGNMEHVTTGYTPPLDTWTHIALVYNGVQVLLYADGSVEGSTALNRDLAQPGGIEIGGSVADGTHTFNGTMDDIRIYNRSMIPGEIQGIYRNGIGLNISANLTPEELEQDLYIYYGFPIAAHPGYTASDLYDDPTYTPQLIDIGLTQEWAEVIALFQDEVRELDSMLGATITAETAADGCLRIGVRSTDLNLETRVC